jgi:hypothetical protein
VDKHITSRRAVLAGAGGIAAAGALSTAAMALPVAAVGRQVSAEFLEYQRLYEIHRDLCEVADDDASQARANQACDALWQVIDHILGRPPCGWQDVIEIAGVMRSQLDYEDDFAEALLNSIETMAAKGGANV